MRRLIAFGAVLATAGSLGGWALASALGPPLKPPPSEIVQFGYIKSIVAKGTSYELRFDPAYFLEGETANRAAVEDGVAKPGEGVPNDYYILNPDHRLLTYRLPASAKATVITVSVIDGSTPVSIAELAQIAAGKNPRHRKLIEMGSRRTLGYWVRTSVDTVRSLDQQFQP